MCNVNTRAFYCTLFVVYLCEDFLHQLMLLTPQSQTSFEVIHASYLTFTAFKHVDRNIRLLTEPNVNRSIT